MFNTLRTLTQLNGISGREDSVIAYICSCLEEYGREYTVDALGNIIVNLKGMQTPSRKIMVSAHMDEVGLICTDITDEGFLRFATVGGIDPSVIVGRSVTVNGCNGVIGTKAVHMQSADEKNTVSKIDDLLVDIGATSKKDALKYVNLGDEIYFYSEYAEYGDNQITAKALDDRIGCAILLELAKNNELPYDITLLFATQEEVGLRGATAAVQTIKPDVAFVVEATTAADIPNVDEHNQVCKLGYGAVVSFMDKSTIYDKELYRLAFTLAQERGIPCQTKTVIAGGNDAGAIHKSAGGVRTLAISVPSRYIHSPSCTVKRQDIENVYMLLWEMIMAVC